jgi:hypothetical protein
LVFDPSTLTVIINILNKWVLTNKQGAVQMVRYGASKLHSSMCVLSIADSNTASLPSAGLNLELHHLYIEDPRFAIYPSVIVISSLTYIHPIHIMHVPSVFLQPRNHYVELFFLLYCPLIVFLLDNIHVK